MSTKKRARSVRVFGFGSLSQQRTERFVDKLCLAYAQAQATSYRDRQDFAKKKAVHNAKKLIFGSMRELHANNNLMNDVSANVLNALPDLNFTVPGLGSFDAAPYVAALGMFLLLSFFFKLILMTVIARLKSLSEKTHTDLDDVVIDAFMSVRAWVYTLIALYIALQFFVLPNMVDKVLTGLVYFAVAWQAIEIALRFVRYAVMRFVAKDEDGDGVIDPNAATASDMIILMARITLWTMGGLFVLSNLGIEITSLVAGLGIGGIAVAFALQGILSDLFASFSIYFDKPFRVGDFVVIGSDSGNVEKIGIKTTRIRTLQGEELVVSNAELTTARVQNFKKLKRRRIVAQFGVTYETDRAQLKAIPEVVRSLFDAIEQATIDRVHFQSFGDSALMFEVVYYIESDDYTTYMDKQQQFNYALIDRFAEMGIEFAYPTQTLYVKQ